MRADMVAELQLPEAVTGDCVPLRGSVQACIGVGSLERRMPLYVADVEEPYSLCLDYLLPNDACVDLGWKWLGVADKSYPWFWKTAARR